MLNQLDSTNPLAPVIFPFRANGVGVSALDVEITLVRLNLDGTWTTLLTEQSPVAGPLGHYGYVLPPAVITAPGYYVAIAQTDGEVDEPELSAGWLIGLPWVERLDDDVTSRLADGDYTAPANGDIAEIKSKTDTLPASPAAVGSAMTLSPAERTSVAAAVRVNLAAELAKLSSLALDGGGRVTVGDIIQSARDLIAVTVEQHLLDEGDGQMLLEAIVGAIGNQNVDEVALVATIRADMERAGGSLKLIEGKTTNLPASPAASGDIPSASATADAVWTRSERTLSAFAFTVTTANAGDVTNILATTTKLDSMLENVGGWRWTAGSLEQAPAGGGGGGGGASVSGIWGEDLPGDYPEGSAGWRLGQVSGSIIQLPGPPADPETVQVVGVFASPENLVPCGADVIFELITPGGAGAAASKIIAFRRVEARIASDGVLTSKGGHQWINLIANDTEGMPEGSYYAVTIRQASIEAAPLVLAAGETPRDLVAWVSEGANDLT